MPISIRLQSVEPVQAGQVFKFRTDGGPNAVTVDIRIEQGRFPDDEASLRVAKAHAANIIEALAEETKASRMSVSEIKALEAPKRRT
tara:strand:+ start:3351 stop:3611 length:261 start_codon:yes stop_codon:yes gene_type:complete